MEHLSVSQIKDLRAETYLNSLLMNTPPGDKLPGMNLLVQESGVGRIRLERVLAKLCEAGKLKVRSRSGYYRTVGGDEDKRIVLIDLNDNYALPVVKHKNLTIFVSFWQALTSELSRLCKLNGYELVFHSLRNDLSGVGDFFRNNRFAGVFIRGSCCDEVTALFANCLCCVELLPQKVNTSYPAVLDSLEMTAMQMDYLLQRGYRHIGYLHQIGDSRLVVQNKRLCDYYRVMAENGIAIEPNWVMYCGYDYEVFNRHLHRVMKSKRPPEALIVDGNTVPAVYRFCADNGIAVGRDLAIMGCDDLTPNLKPRVTSVINSPFEIATQGWRIMEAALCGKKLVEHTKLMIVTGESVPIKVQSSRESLQGTPRTDCGAVGN